MAEAGAGAVPALCVMTVLVMVGLFPWSAYRVPTPMDQMARVYSRWPDVAVYCVDPNWAVSPGERWRQATEGQSPAQCWRVWPLSAEEASSTAAGAVFLDVEGRSASPTELLAALDGAERVVVGAHSFWPEVCRRLVEALSPDAVYYDCHETVVTLAGGPARAAHQWLVAHADAVAAISPAVADAVRGLGREPLLLGNGIDGECFAAARPAEPEYGFGFVGAFYDWLDVPALEALAVACPDETLALIGPVHESMGQAYERLAALPNVAARPGVGYGEVPDLLQRIEVCLLPRRLTPDSMACDPLKLYEYLAAGRPVASTRVPAAEALGALVYLADGGARFVAAAQAALADVRAGRFDPAAGRAAMAARTWEMRCATIWSALAGRQDEAGPP